MKAIFAAMLLVLASFSAAAALAPEEMLQDRQLEMRARALGQQLRCMVCQNQSIDDSDAQLAKDLRLIVRERLVAGDSDSAILDFVEARYGAFVLLKPRLNTQTALLWGSPLILIGCGLLLIWRRKMPKGDQPVSGLTAEEEARIERLLGDNKY